MIVHVVEDQLKCLFSLWWCWTESGNHWV